MGTLVKEVIGAVAVAEIVEPPRFLRRFPVHNNFAIDQDLNSTYVAGKVASVPERLSELRGTDVQVMLR